MVSGHKQIKIGATFYEGDRLRYPVRWLATNADKADGFARAVLLTIQPILDAGANRLAIARKLNAALGPWWRVDQCLGRQRPQTGGLKSVFVHASAGCLSFKRCKWRNFQLTCQGPIFSNRSPRLPVPSSSSVTARSTHDCA